MRMGRMQRWALGAGVTLVLFTLFWVSYPLLNGIGPCRKCHGQGYFEPPAEGGIPPEEIVCPRCDGAGGIGSWKEAGLVLRRRVRRLPFARGEELWEHRAEIAFAVLFGGAVGWFFWATRVAACRMCRGSGRLRLIARFDGLGWKEAELRCAYCGAAGRLTNLDRFCILSGLKGPLIAGPTSTGGGPRRRPARAG